MGNRKPQPVQLRTTNHIDPVKNLPVDVESGKVGKDGGVRSKIILETIIRDEIQPKMAWASATVVGLTFFAYSTSLSICSTLSP